jgi:hypothetical protein
MAHLPISPLTLKSQTSYSVLWFPEGWSPLPHAENQEALVIEIFSTARDALCWAEQRVLSGGSALTLANQRTSHILIGKFGKPPERFAQAIIGRPIDLS